jgi:biotin carboxylase
MKDNSKTEKFCFNEEILKMCSDFQKISCLEQPYNIQFKYMDDIPYFLEVNTRMSGGVQMACLASGVNLPNIAVNKLLGRKFSWKICETEKKIGQILLPVILD